VWGAQQFAAIARKNPDNGRLDLATSFTPADLALVSAKILGRCDALDGLADGIVADLAGCQRRFRPESDLPTCAGAADGSCLTAAQKTVLQTVFAGPKSRDGTPFYAGLPWDAGIRGSDWRAWKFSHSVGPRDAVALAFVFTTPPASPEVVNGRGTSLIDHALNFSLERDAPKIFATAGHYTESAMSFMTPPEATRLERFVARGGRLMVFHGASDPVFSVQDTIAWYEGFRAHHGRRADGAARLFVVPGMNHGRGGPATDQFDMVDALVAWVEQGIAPDAVVARARGAGAAVANPELPREWSPVRTRLLCPYPAVPRHVGGSSEEAISFRCQDPS
jgi:feruloyl esterase